MIDSLDSDDLRLDRRSVLVHVPEELQLRSRWAHDEDRLCPLESLRDIPEESMHVVRMIVFGGGPLRMAMNVPLRRGNRLRVDTASVDAEDPRFMVINPHDRLM